MSIATRSDDPSGDGQDYRDQQDRQWREDGPATYAPKWLRERAQPPRNVVAMRLPEAPPLSPTAPPRRDEHLVAPELDRAAEGDLGIRSEPEWPRERPRAERGETDWSLPSFLRASEPGFAGDRDIRRVWRQQSLAPTPVPEPPVREAPAGGLSIGVVLRLGGAIAAAALVALVAVVLASPEMRSRSAIFASRPAAPPVKAAARAEDAWPGTPAWPADQAMPAVRDNANGAPARVQTVTITARPPEAVTSGTAPVVAPPESEPVIAVPTAPAAAAINADELARMVKRGEEFVDQGDFAAARLILQRAANAGDARAALVLGATYDPTVLRQLRVMGFKPDIGTARSWYQKAAQSGSAEAARRLTALANLGD